MKKRQDHSVLQTGQDYRLGLFRHVRAERHRKTGEDRAHSLSANTVMEVGDSDVLCMALMVPN
jgi:hypothetical protein